MRSSAIIPAAALVLALGGALEGPAQSAPAPEIRILGSFEVGGTARVQRPGRGRVRWQARTPDGWTPLTPKASREVTFGPDAGGRPVRAVVRRGGRWWPSVRRLVSPALEVAGPVDGRLSVGAPPGSARVRWQTRESTGARWRARTEGPAYVPSPEQAGGIVRAQVRIQGRWWPTPEVALGETSAAPEPHPFLRGPLLGTQDDRLPVVRRKKIGRRLDLVARTGTQLSRVDLFWSDIAPTEPADPTNAADPAYDWRRADAILKGLAARDITAIVSVYSAPRWATGGLDRTDAHPVNPFAPDPNAFGEFIAAVAQRYSGDYVRQARSRPLPEVRFLEMWNEPNIPMFLRPQRVRGRLVSLPTYIAIARAGYAGAKASNPRVNVLVGALGSGRSARRFRDGLRRADVPLDAFSHHLYPRAAPLRATKAYPSWSSLPELVRVLDEWRPGLPLFITEAGYSTEESSFRPRGSAVSERRQARFLSDIFRVPLVRSGRVNAIIWFNLQANDAWPTGLLRADGSRKPSYRRFVELLRRGEGGG